MRVGSLFVWVVGSLSGRKIRADRPGEIVTSLEWTSVLGSKDGGTESVLRRRSIRPSL